MSASLTSCPNSLRISTSDTLPNEDLMVEIAPFLPVRAPTTVLNSSVVDAALIADVPSLTACASCWCSGVDEDAMTLKRYSPSSGANGSINGAHGPHAWQQQCQPLQHSGFPNGLAEESLSTNRPAHEGLIHEIRYPSQWRHSQTGLLRT